MMMAATTYRIKTNNSNFYVVGALVIGFASLLKGWWDHYLSQTDKEYILNTKKKIIIIKEKKHQSKLMKTLSIL